MLAAQPWRPGSLEDQRTELKKKACNDVVY